MKLVWFRNDLRVADNPAFSAAMRHKGDRVVAVYCLCEGQWDLHAIGVNQRSLILKSLSQLEKSLAKLNVPLVILCPNLFQHVPLTLADLCETLDVSDLFFNMEYPVNERRRDQAVVQQLEGRVQCHRKVGQSLVAPWEIVNGEGGGYKVYTAYARQVFALLDRSPVLCEGTPDKRSADNMQLPSIKGALQVLPTVSPNAEIVPDISEVIVQQRLKAFCEGTISNYKGQRDIPSIKGTSELSTSLAIGTLSVTRCYHEANAVGGQSAYTWINELVWRDFYRSVVWHYPHVCKGKAFNSVDFSVPWSTSSKSLGAWQRGETGVPIVDAAMNQLNQTGWMHNRLRMVVASYLTKNLFLDWRLGEAYFANQLFDFDFASNNGGWQWSASVGTDAAPYFRVFNPASQQKKFDPDASFIKSWIPQLSNYTAKEIHQFESKQLTGYFQPQVDLKATRKVAIEKFKTAKLMSL